MKTSLIVMAAAIGLVVWSSSARAQQAVRAPAAPTVGSVPGVVGVGQPVQTHPYSYYTVFPAPARTYVEFGPMDQFPFRGQMYGSPGDRWSWSGMMGNRAAGLDRYYYQLLP